MPQPFRDPKICTRCKKPKPRSAYYPRSKGSPYIDTICKACRSEIAKDGWANNTPRMEKLRARTARLYAENRALLDRLRDVPCADCGGRFPPYVMDFDHRDPTSKKHNLSEMTRLRPERIKEEAAKCEIVCANCHRIRTHQKKE